jgi:hypothetical protein
MENFDMTRLAVLTAAAALLASGASTALAGPVTQQNGKTPVFKAFTSICAVPGYVNYGNCAGDPTTYEDVTGKVNAVQAKAGRWNLGVSFKGLEPGRYYRLWGNRTGSTPLRGDIDGFFVIGTALAALDGTARFSYQTTDPKYLGFDLNILDDPEQLRGITVVTSYWSEQALQVLNPDGSLYVPGS